MRDNEQLKIELLSQWKLEAESRNFDHKDKKQDVARFSVNLPSCVPLASVSLSLLASPSTSLDHLICLQVTIFKSLLLSFVGVQNWHCQWGPFPSHSTPIQDETGREKCKKPTVTRHSIKTRDLAEGASLWVSPASLNWNVQEACRSFTGPAG